MGSYLTCFEFPSLFWLALAHAVPLLGAFGGSHSALFFLECAANVCNSLACCVCEISPTVDLLAGFLNHASVLYQTFFPDGDDELVVFCALPDPGGLEIGSFRLFFFDAFGFTGSGSRLSSSFEFVGEPAVLKPSSEPLE